MHYWGAISPNGSLYLWSVPGEDLVAVFVVEVSDWPNVLSKISLTLVRTAISRLICAIFLIMGDTSGTTDLQAANIYPCIIRLILVGFLCCLKETEKQRMWDLFEFFNLGLVMRERRPSDLMLISNNPWSVTPRFGHVSRQRRRRVLPPILDRKKRVAVSRRLVNWQQTAV